MDSLAKLFGSVARLKILRLFLFNHELRLTQSEVEERAKVARVDARQELALLTSSGLLQRKKSKVAKYGINAKFEHLAALEQFVRSTTALRSPELLAKLKRAGQLRLVVLSGLFTGVAETGTDLLIVGEALQERALKQAAQAIEAEFGRELRYATFSTADFRYRLGVYDRLIRDVFDYPHKVLLDKIGL